MKFFDAFKTLQVEEPLKSVFQGVEVVAVSLVKSGNFLRVKISPNQMITTENFRKMENELACQVLNNIMSCRIEYENGYEYAEAGSGAYVAAPEKKEASQPAPLPGNGADTSARGGLRCRRQDRHRQCHRPVFSGRR